MVFRRGDVGRSVAAALSVAFVGFLICVAMIYNGRSGLQPSFSMYDLTVLYETSMLDGDAGAALKVGIMKRCGNLNFYFVATYGFT